MVLFVIYYFMLVFAYFTIEVMYNGWNISSMFILSGVLDFLALDLVILLDISKLKFSLIHFWAD